MEAVKEFFTSLYLLARHIHLYLNRCSGIIDRRACRNYRKRGYGYKANGYTLTAANNIDLFQDVWPVTVVALELDLAYYVLCNKY